MNCEDGNRKRCVPGREGEMGLRWFDSHAHISDRQFASDRAAVIQRARSDGMGGWLEIGYSRDTIPAALRLAEEEKGCWAAVGLHPYAAHDSPQVEEAEFACLLAHLSHPSVVALGEMGLDTKASAPLAVQERLLRRQMSLARERGLPVVIHCRGAYEQLLSVLREERVSQVGGVLHCFSGTVADLRVGLSLGLHIGFGGVVTFRNAAEVQAAAQEVPLDRLLLETDAPYLAPQPRRGKRNELSFLLHSAREMATLRSESFEELLHAATENAYDLFGVSAEGEG